MLIGLHVATNFEMYRQNSEKALLGGGGGNCPPALPPATLMAGNAKEADIWFGRESAREARGKFKDLVCLVVFLCWIKRFVLLSLCLKCKYMNRYISSFQKSRGGGDDPPRKIRGGGGGGADTSRPVPPGSPPIKEIHFSNLLHQHSEKKVTYKYRNSKFKLLKILLKSMGLTKDYSLAIVLGFLNPLVVP